MKATEAGKMDRIIKKMGDSQALKGTVSMSSFFGKAPESKDVDSPAASDGDLVADAPAGTEATIDRARSPAEV